MIRVDNESYIIYDWKLPFITLSKTTLHPHKKTMGHKHSWRELYFTPPFSLRIYKPNEFHQVENTNNCDLSFFTAWRNKHKRTRVVAVAGGWDPLHPWHIRHMKLARKLGDWLVVIVDNDDNLIKKKGFAYYPQEWRIELLRDYSFINQIVLNIDHSGCCAETLNIIKPDVFAKGGDRTPDNMPEREIQVCREIGCRIIYGIGETGFSSTQRVRELAKIIGGLK